MSSSRRRTSRQKRKQEAAAKRRLPFIIGGVVVVAVIVVLVLVLSNKPQQPAVVGDIITVPTQTWPMADGTALGPANAPVVVKEFADYQCPYCRQFEMTIQNQLIQEFVTTGKVRFEYHNFIVIDQNVGGTESYNAAMASLCANAQGKFWDYHQILFANQQSEGSGAFSDARLKAFAESLGLDMTKFNSCMSSKQYASTIAADEAMGRSLNVTGTPSLFVNDQQVANPLDYTALKTAIDAALNAAQ